MPYPEVTTPSSVVHVSALATLSPFDNLRNAMKKCVTFQPRYPHAHAYWLIHPITLTTLRELTAFQDRVPAPSVTKYLGFELCVPSIADVALVADFPLSEIHLIQNGRTIGVVYNIC